jgi:hypothetical protein
MEPEGSLPHSQEPATCPYPEQFLKLLNKFQLQFLLHFALNFSGGINFNSYWLSTVFVLQGTYIVLHCFITVRRIIRYKRRCEVR